MTPARPRTDPSAVVAHGRRAVSTARPQRRELDHRVANSLQLAADLLLFEEARLSDPAARAALSRTAARLAAVGQLHRFLCAHDNTAVHLKAFLAELGDLITASTGLTCSVEGDRVAVSGAVAQNLAIAINELAMNAAKHGYRSGEPGALHIEHRRRAGQLCITISDHGRGLGQGFRPDGAHGLGMSIVQAIVRQLHATLEAHDDHGARFTITLPPAAEAAAPSRSFAPVDRL